MFICNSDGRYWEYWESICMSELLRLLNNVNLWHCAVMDKQGGVQIVFHWRTSAFLHLELVERIGYNELSLDHKRYLQLYCGISIITIAKLPFGVDQCSPG